MAKSIAQEFTKGLWKEIPPFRIVLGLCPTLALTKSVESGFGMGVMLTFVLVCSNVLISLLRKIIPGKVRIACFIIVVATFVIIVELLMQAYAYTIYEKMGIFIPLIVVNCIPLGRAEAFASKNGVLASTADGLGIGIGYTMALSLLGVIREVIGTGSLVGEIPFLFSYKVTNIFGSSYEPFRFMIEAPGAFVGLGLLLAIMNMLGKK